jgi:hypothetical protein
VEQGHAECTDGIDNDRDGLVDCEEGYCKSSCEENCTDYVDNDRDGFNGCDDPKCAGKECFEPREICWNEHDEDGNGVNGCQDPACFEDPDCLKLNPEICDNGVDDNVDGDADCDDPECDRAPNCEQCDDGIDNDEDGLTDCEDLPRCRVPCGLIEACTGGLDEDEDGAIDCQDSDCSDHGECIAGCRVRQLADSSGAPTYEDTCATGYVCTCPGAPGCPTPNPNAGELIGDLIGASELCGEPQTCEEGGGCRPLAGVYTLRFRRAQAPVDDPLNDPELYVVVNDEQISGVGDDYTYYCDDCYRIITVPEVSSINVKLWEGDFLPPDDLLAECDFTLGEATLKQRVLTCRASNNGIATGALVELTLDPHVAP